MEDGELRMGEKHGHSGKRMAVLLAAASRGIPIDLSISPLSHG